MAAVGMPAGGTVGSVTLRHRSVGVRSWFGTEASGFNPGFAPKNWGLIPV